MNSRMRRALLPMDMNMRMASCAAVASVSDRVLAAEVAGRGPDLPFWAHLVEAPKVLPPSRAASSNGRRAEVGPDGDGGGREDGEAKRPHAEGRRRRVGGRAAWRAAAAGSLGVSGAGSFGRARRTAAIERQWAGGLAAGPPRGERDDGGRPHLVARSPARSASPPYGFISARVAARVRTTRAQRRRGQRCGSLPLADPGARAAPAVLGLGLLRARRARVEALGPGARVRRNRGRVRLGGRSVADARVAARGAVASTSARVIRGIVPRAAPAPMPNASS